MLMSYGESRWLDEAPGFRVPARWPTAVFDSSFSAVSVEANLR
jgi:hypothetical protein